MTTKDEALKMAIEFMETLTIDVGIKTWNEKHRKEAIQACKEALEQPTNMVTIPLDKLEDMQRRLKEQPTQEPVAWMHCVDEDITEFNDFQACPKCEPLYTHPKEWQGLTAEEIASIPLNEHTVQAVEDLLRSKNK